MEKIQSITVGNSLNIERALTAMINHIWDFVAELAGVAGRTPHSAQHAKGAALD